tara:strand:+ start:1695 stop:1859 length:165 start_codon:yes stop_codon:yes gene_type:complete
MKIGDLVTRDVWRGFYQIMEIYENSYRAKRLRLLNLMTGKYVEDIRPSHVKVMS